MPNGTDHTLLFAVVVVLRILTLLSNHISSMATDMHLSEIK